MVNSAGMLIGYGVIKGDYLSIPQNFKLNDIRLENAQSQYKLRGIQISSGNATSFVAITNLNLQRATLEFHKDYIYSNYTTIGVTYFAATRPVNAGEKKLKVYNLSIIYRWKA